MEENFTGQTVIISGGLGDIGFATGEAFAALGASLALGDIHSPEVARPYLQKLEAAGAKALYTQVDVSDETQVSRWVEQTDAALGPPRITIACAAIVNRAGVHEIAPASWRKELDVNLNGAFFLVQAATGLLVKKGLSGRVVFVGSWAATHVHGHMAAYSVSKAALSMLSKCFALELASKHILVNEIAPGYVDAGLSGQNWKKNPEARERARERVPLKQLITAEEVASQILYLCGPGGKHMTGSILLMDGGLSLP